MSCIGWPSPFRLDTPKSSCPLTNLRQASAGVQSSLSPMRINVGTVMGPFTAVQGGRMRPPHETSSRMLFYEAALDGGEAKPATLRKANNNNSSRINELLLNEEV